MTPHVRLSVGRSVIIPFKGREGTLTSSYQSTCLLMLMKWSWGFCVTLERLCTSGQRGPRPRYLTSWRPLQQYTIIDTGCSENIARLKG